MIDEMRLDRIEFALERLREDDDYKNAIWKCISILGRDSIHPSDVTVRIAYDNPNGLNYIMTTLNKVSFEGKAMIVDNSEYDKMTIINSDCIKTIDIKK